MAGRVSGPRLRAPRGRAGAAPRVTAVTASFLVAGLALAAAYPGVAEPRSFAPFPPGAVDLSLRGAAPAFGVLAVAAWLARGHRLAATAAFVGTLLTVALGAALYAAALGAESPTAPLRALRLVPHRQLVSAAITAFVVTLARRSPSP